MNREIKKIIESLSSHERKLLRYLEELQGEKNVILKLCAKSNLDKISVLRSLNYLENKKIIKLFSEKKKIVVLDVNGLFYKKKGLPERKLLSLLSEVRFITLKDAQDKSKLSYDEFKASIGILKKMKFIEIKNGKIFLKASPEEVSKKTKEELLIEKFPIDEKKLSEEELRVLKSLRARKKIIQIKEKIYYWFKLTEFGNDLIKNTNNIKDFIESVTPEMLRDESLWKNKKFRRYDVTSNLPLISGGKKHFVTQSVDYTKKIWLEFGFEELTGNFIVSSFWNFDALFTPQDHPVREMQDTFFINEVSDLPEKNLVERVKKSHESGVEGSEGWGYKWKEENAKKTLLRTHTTVLSSKMLSKINPKELPKKFFAVGRVFRNETLDWKHGFEFNQTEGIVVDRNVNFRNLLGYLKNFAEKIGLKNIRFRPAYFPYTEPSVEGDVWDDKKHEWVELFAAGILRPEVVVPLLGENIPVLAWGPGIDRIILKILKINDMRDLYKNNLNQLRKIKFLIK